MLRLVDQTSDPSVAKVLDPIARACSRALHDVAVAWGEDVWRLVAAIDASGFAIVIRRSGAAPDVLGWHDLDASGNPRAVICLEPILMAGGTLTDGANSLSVAIDHEVKEIVGDPAANLWANDRAGVGWARELCDAVEGDSYEDPETGVSLSNFLLPAYFNPLDTKGPYDHLGVLTRPFEIAANGYAIRWSGGYMRPVYGRDVTAERRALIRGRLQARRNWTRTPDPVPTAR